ncbi:MAG: TIM barrel protein [Acetivibrionales bacterium]|jgi:hydroxypyruvate isomerase
MKISDNIECFAPENMDFYDRIRLAKESGFDAIEFWGWEGKDLNRIKKLCDENNLVVNAFSGDAQYSLCDDREMSQYIDYIEQSIKAAKVVECDTLVIHSNALDESGKALHYYNEYSSERKYGNMLRTLLELKPVAEANKITLVLESLNTLVDHQGYYLDDALKAAEIVRLVDSPYIKILFDVYHMQIMKGNLCNMLEQVFDTLGHVHIADNPGRFEPGTGEINFAAIFSKLRELGYDRYIGFELTPKNNYEDAAKKCTSL